MLRLFVSFQQTREGLWEARPGPQHALLYPYTLKANGFNEKTLIKRVWTETPDGSFQLSKSITPAAQWYSASSALLPAPLRPWREGTIWAEVTGPLEHLLVAFTNLAGALYLPALEHSPGGAIL